MENTKTPRRDLLVELGLEDSIVFENPDYDSAIIGYDANDSRIIYDYETMAEHLMDVDGMTYEEAIEFIEYNTLRSIPYAGKDAPIVLQSIRDYLPYHEATKKYEYNFDVKYHLERCIAWTRAWFDINLPGHKAVIGMSGGKDSTIAAAILAKALGPENVIGVAMPDMNQGDNEAEYICKHLGIRYMNMPIGNITNEFNYMWEVIGDEDFKWSKQAETNIPPRIRMTMLYAVAQTYNGVVINTCNISEAYLGYETLYGDGAGSMSPIKNFTATEIIALGDELGLPYGWVHKTPDDGLPNSSPDEEKFGFSYETLDNWIRKAERVDDETMNKILTKNKNSQFKRDILNIPAYDPNLKVY
jgi:NAD+ synthase